MLHTLPREVRRCPKVSFAWKLHGNFLVSNIIKHIKGKTNSLRTNKAKVEGVGFPKITIFWWILTKFMVRLAKIGLKKEIKNL